MSCCKTDGYQRYLIKLPWLKNGIFTDVNVSQAYGRIRGSFEDYGFRIVAEDDQLLRFCAYRQLGSGQCTCIHAVWIVRHGRMTYVSYGIDPRFILFWLCGKGHHLDKLKNCRQIIRGALEGY